jgi:integrase
LNLRKSSTYKLPDIPRREPSTYIPHIFTEEELKKFFWESDHIRTNEGDDSKRRKLIVPVFFRLLYSSGLRICEARWLKCEDIDLKTGVLNIKRTKTSIQHYVAIHESMVKLLISYDKKISELHPYREWFFPGKNGKCIDKKWVKYNFDILWKKVQSPAKATAYCFRHTYATENINKWIGEGFDTFDKLVYLSKSMGHMSIETTMKYYQMTPALADILQEKTATSFSKLLPEGDYEKE